MKTIRQHLKELPEPYNEMALEEMKRQKLGRSRRIIGGQRDAIALAFWWDESKNGFDFWLNFHNSLKK